VATTTTTAAATAAIGFDTKERKKMKTPF